MYNHAPDNYPCPFCALIAHTSPDIVLQTRWVTAFIGTRQWPKNPGNILVIPNQHIENIYDLPLELAAPLFEAAQAVAVALKKVYNCDGVSIRQHNEPEGYQEVWHFHMHVTPHYANDDFYPNYVTSGVTMMPEERARHAALLREPLLDWISGLEK